MVTTAGVDADQQQQNSVLLLIATIGVIYLGAKFLFPYALPFLRSVSSQKRGARPTGSVSVSSAGQPLTSDTRALDELINRVEPDFTSTGSSGSRGRGKKIVRPALPKDRVYSSNSFTASADELKEPKKSNDLSSSTISGDALGKDDDALEDLLLLQSLSGIGQNRRGSKKSGSVGSSSLPPRPSSRQQQSHASPSLLAPTSSPPLRQAQPSRSTKTDSNASEGDSPIVLETSSHGQVPKAAEKSLDRVITTSRGTQGLGLSPEVPVSVLDQTHSAPKPAKGGLDGRKEVNGRQRSKERSKESSNENGEKLAEPPHTAVRNGSNSARSASSASPRIDPFENPTSGELTPVESLREQLAVLEQTKNELISSNRALTAYAQEATGRVDAAKAEAAKAYAAVATIESKIQEAAAKDREELKASHAIESARLNMQLSTLEAKLTDQRRNHATELAKEQSRVKELHVLLSKQKDELESSESQLASMKHLCGESERRKGELQADLALWRAKADRLAQELASAKGIRLREAHVSAVQGRLLKEKDKMIGDLQARLGAVQNPPILGPSSVDASTFAAPSTASQGSQSKPTTASQGSQSSHVKSFISPEATVRDEVLVGLNSVLTKMATALESKMGSMVSIVDRTAPEPVEASTGGASGRHPSPAHRSDALVADEIISGYKATIHSLMATVESGFINRLSSVRDIQLPSTDESRVERRKAESASPAVEPSKSVEAAWQSSLRDCAADQALALEAAQAALASSLAPVKPNPNFGQAKGETSSRLSTSETKSARKIAAGLNRATGGPNVVEQHFQEVLSLKPLQGPAVAIRAVQRLEQSTLFKSSTPVQPSARPTQQKNAVAPGLEPTELQLQEVISGQSAVIAHMSGLLESGVSARRESAIEKGMESTTGKSVSDLVSAEVAEGQARVIAQLASALEGAHGTFTPSIPNTEQKLRDVARVLQIASPLAPSWVGPGRDAVWKTVGRLEALVESKEAFRGDNWRIA
ncbi:hypothetical protein DFJ73DRAFT_441502 [Zopfochytrium polystomum]|nr:hypothetical protein DFJ73DRAFT_441502 [Zopfochytrium polystomum]